MVLHRAARRLTTLASFIMGVILLCRQVPASSSWRGIAAFSIGSKYAVPVASVLVRGGSSRRPRGLGSSTGSSRIGPAPESDPDGSALQRRRSHEKRYRVRGETHDTSRAGVRVTTDTGHVLGTDLPSRMGGRDSAAQPVELLLAALAGCTQATAIFVGRNLRPRRLDVERLVFDLRAARDERGALRLPVESPPEVPSRLHSVRGTVHVHLAKDRPISDDELQLLKEQTERRCPVANMMIASGCEMRVDWVDGSTNTRVDER